MALWAITAYFNPRRFRSRLKNCRYFRAHLKARLLTVEWSQHGEFELADCDADRVLRVQGGSLMWQKERLLAIAAGQLPEDCEAVVLMDADILLVDPCWPEHLLEQLRSNPVVQPFREVRHLPPLSEKNLPDPGLISEHAPFYLVRQSFGDLCVHGRRSMATTTVTVAGADEQQREIARLALRPAVGHAWAVRRDWLDRVGLYEHCVAGCGDLAFALAVSGRAEEFCRSYPLNAAQQSHYRRWAAAAEQAGEAGLGCLDGLAYHLFHGDLNRRAYRSRLAILADSAFNPARHLLAPAGQPFQWSDDDGSLESLRLFFQNYFRERDEDKRA